MESNGRYGVIGVIAAVLLVVVVLVACYLGNWWLFADSVNRTGRIRQDSFEHQQGLITAAQQKSTDVSRIDVQITSTGGDVKTALINQRAAVVSDACADISQISEDLPADLARFKSKECS